MRDVRQPSSSASTHVLLIRHATYPLLDRALVGRMPDVHLDAHGRTQAERLADRLATRPLRAIYSSPLDRALETAEPLARRLLLPVYVSPALTDVDAGAWTGCAFEALAADTAWHAYNQARSRTAPPGGESLTAVTARIVRELTRLWRRHAGATIAIVTHGDVIRAALLHYRGRSLDDLHAISIPPASVTTLNLQRCRHNDSSMGAPAAMQPARPLHRVDARGGKHAFGASGDRSR